jgi:hypothetical protein
MFMRSIRVWASPAFISYRLKEVELWGPVPYFLLILVVGFLPSILSASVLGPCTVMFIEILSDVEIYF